MKVEYDTIVLGAGLGGIGIGATLKRAGLVDFLIVEKAARAGGTWRENVYPGAACDTESHLYSYSFQPNKRASRLYVRQPELLDYAEALIAEQGLAPHIAFGREIVSARWDAAALRWELRLADGITLRARCFIAAWGQLNRPLIPNIPGRASFGGLQFHSACWRSDFDLQGKRIASIGNAASAIQYIAEIAPLAGHLTIFQRSPNWIVPRGDRAYSDDEIARFVDHSSAYAESRQALFAWRETTFMRMREGSDEAREVEQLARAHLEKQVADPTLRAKLLPDFPLGCKRVLRSDNYYPALVRPNVALVTDPIEAITPEGVRTAEGIVCGFDVIIWGTGFETQSFQGPVEIWGEGGASLRDEWHEGARAYRGVTVPGFPNLFLIYGPNTNLGHNSVLSMFEAQFAYIVQAITLAVTEHVAVDVRREVFEASDAQLQAEMAGSAWSGNCMSWYKNAAGRVVNNWSGPVESYIALTCRFDREAYRLIEAAAAHG